ncbi:MAG: hypothetical protein KJ579_10800, partial [Verrucomicrobia bacterium]|nr:hypothetical protein [Verrucomicrobiota bacterium]
VQDAALRLLAGETNGAAFVTFADECRRTNLIPAFARQAFWSRPPRFVGLVPATPYSRGYLWMEWGGHFVGYVGLGAGPDDFKLSDDIDGDSMEWKRGVYVWWRDEFGPPPTSATADGAANGSQPTRAEIRPTPEAAGTRR